MKLETTIIKKAVFSPNIKTYILIVVSLLLLITIISIPILIIWFLGLGQYISKRYYENLECQLNNRHLEFKKGVLFRVEKTIPLENIQDLTFIENPLLKYLDLRILKIETAGQSNPKGSDMKLVGIVDAQEFKEAVLNQREVIQSRSKENSQSISTSEKTNILLEEIRDLLNEIKK
ncbi:PH domain-containing protein [Sabulilitoribacter multivorans]|uniref:PH domain-containing protein n=1 Tax=Flaviramulus multivorans TaxID=1304750 RepID=A0ABS9IJX1_9FLAO|nr:PH domain-containing protein [Flaviramulus multivorans]MCF7560889.1 PH domain-containing protein [Flaviramulus multivorans]